MSVPEFVHKLDDIKQCETLFGADKKLLIFKHSTRCPISAGAYEEWLHYLEDHRLPEMEYAIVFVVESRPVSNFIAERFNVKHESPQVILLENGRVVWHASHWDITYTSLVENVGEKKREV